MFVVVCLAACVAQGAQVAFDSGTFKIAGLRCEVIHCGPNWERSPIGELRPETGYPKYQDGRAELRGVLPVRPAGALQMEQILIEEDGRYAFSARATSPQPIPTNTLSLVLALPADPYAGETLRIDGAALELPIEPPAQPHMYTNAQARSIVIPVGNGEITIEGPVDVLIQDDRHWAAQQFSMRLNFAPAKGEIRESELRVAMRVPPGAEPLKRPVEITAGLEWRAYPHELDVEAGGILDFSSLLDAPAGKHGRVVVRDGHFAFENQPGKPVRFYGTNLCFGTNFPSHEQADQLADRLARMGYNSARLHHYDNLVIDHSAADSVTLDRQQVDKIEYLVAALKKRGIYITIDLFTIREPKAHEIPEMGDARESFHAYKALVPMLDSAMANWQAFARNLLTHRNPYTGLTWAEDPIFLGICPLNEDTLGIHHQTRPEVSELYQRRFEAWLTEQKLTPADDAQRQSAYSRFLAETQTNANRRIFAFLRGIGVKSLLTGVNCLDHVAVTPVRAELDYVDVHTYWDQPVYAEKAFALPQYIRNTSVISAGAESPRTSMPCRLLGKPYTVTEFDNCLPNQFRAETGPVIGAYASLQQWDGLWRFAWSHDLKSATEVAAAIGYDSASDPLAMLSDRIGILMFLRGDVSPAKRTIPIAVTPSLAYAKPAFWGPTGYDQKLEYLGLHTGIGSVWGTAPETSYQPPAESFDLARKRVVSDTGEIELAGLDGTFRVATPRLVSFTLIKAGEMSAQSAGVQTEGAATIAAAAMDGKELSASSRILIFHLTDLQNTRTRFAGRLMTLQEQWGELPHLVRAGKARLRLERATASKATLYPLDAAGRRQQPIEVVRDGDDLILPLDTTAGKSPTLAYELVCE